MISFDHVVEIALLLLAAYLCGCIIGYFTHRMLRHSAPRPALPATPQIMVASPAKPSGARRLAGIAERDVPPTAAAPRQINRPPELPAPRGGRPDDLRRIKGIGAKTEAALNNLGIYHYDQIAAWHSSNLDWLEGRIAVKGRIRREQWVEQAVLLATDTSVSAD